MRIALTICALLYPCAAYLATTRGHLAWSAGLLALALILQIRAKSSSPRSLIVAVFAGVGALLLSSHIPTLPLYYPVGVNLCLLVTFLGSLMKPPCIIERFASLARGPLPPDGQRYCRRVCFAWVGFFLINGLIAYDSLHRSLEWWGLYNGCISYVMMGTLFACEYLVRIRVMKKARPILSLGVLLLLVGFGSAIAHASPSLNIEQIRQHLHPPTPFRSAFKEQRYIAALTAPLESEGEIRCLPQKGILWSVRHPIERTTVITPAKLTIFGGTGERENISDRANISSALLSLMGGSGEEALDSFTLAVSGTTTAWSITLTPKDTLIAEIVSVIAVSGSNRPEILEVRHANGDKVITRFSKPQSLSLSEIEELHSALNEAL